MLLTALIVSIDLHQLLVRWCTITGSSVGYGNTHRLGVNDRNGVKGGKTPREYMLSELPQAADIGRSAFHHSANPLALRITGSGSEQFHARL